MTLLLAGHETTASALTWTLYLLGRHPWAQRRVQAEADTLDGGQPAPATLPALRYTRAVITEAIRLYPPAGSSAAPLTADLELGGWHLPPGSVAAVSPLLLHRDPRWYPDPERFDPGRWLGDRAPPSPARLPALRHRPAVMHRRAVRLERGSHRPRHARPVLDLPWRSKFRPALSYQVTLRPSAGMPMIVHARAGI